MYFKAFFDPAITLYIFAIFTSSFTGAPFGILSQKIFERIVANDIETVIRRPNKLNTTKCYEVAQPPNRNKDQQLVLQGVTADGDDAVKDSASCLVLTGTSTVVTSGMLQVYPLHQKSIIKVCEESRCIMSGPPADLSIVVMSPRECHLNMLDFGGNCYLVSANEQTASDVMAGMGGSSQLASFSDMTDVNKFIEANNKHLDKPPYKRKLSLKSPVRIGLFRWQGQADLYTIVRNQFGSCSLQSIFKFYDLLSTNSTAESCVTLKVDDSEKAKLELADCSRAMPSLLSFPAASPEATNCITREMLQKLNMWAAQQHSNNSEMHKKIHRNAIGLDKTNESEGNGKKNALTSSAARDVAIVVVSSIIALLVVVLVSLAM